MDLWRGRGSISVMAKRQSSPLVVAFASLIGTSIEWYDFFIFGAASALAFPKLFFPAVGDLGVLAAFAVFWVAFLGRPIGGMIFGHYGDRIGRKAMLVLTLLLMGTGTLLVGVLPTYAAIGIWAPVLLTALRLFQGVAVGGEWGGAVLMATEHAPPQRRGAFGSFPQLGTPIGGILSTSIFGAVTAAFSRYGHLQDAFFSYGWRIPFLLSAVLVLVGLGVRLSVTESPVFERVKEEAAVVKRPLLTVLVTQWKSILLAAGAFFGANLGYLYSTQILAYASGPDSLLKIPAREILSAVAIGNVAFLAGVALSGWLSDRAGRLSLCMSGAVLALLAAFPIYMLIDTKQWPLIVLGECIAWFGNGMMYGPLAALFSEMFPGNVRYSGVSIGYQGASIFAGGLAPLVGSALLRFSGGESWVLSLYLMVGAAISLTSYLLIREQRRAQLAQLATESPGGLNLSHFVTDGSETVGIGRD
jgi:MFS transporter, MHS family, shikimate and dehydroshikimate transport protein